MQGYDTSCCLPVRALPRQARQSWTSLPLAPRKSLIGFSSLQLQHRRRGSAGRSAGGCLRPSGGGNGGIPPADSTVAMIAGTGNSLFVRFFQFANEELLFARRLIECEDHPHSCKYCRELDTGVTQHQKRRSRYIFRGHLSLANCMEQPAKKTTTGAPERSNAPVAQNERIQSEITPYNPDKTPTGRQRRARPTRPARGSLGSLLHHLRLTSASRGKFFSSKSRDPRKPAPPRPARRFGRRWRQTAPEGNGPSRYRPEATASRFCRPGKYRLRYKRTRRQRPETPQL